MCKQFTYCSGDESPKPIYFTVGKKRTKDNHGKSVEVAERKAFPRCPTAMVEPTTWALIDHAKQYLAGLMPKDFTPSAQFAEAVLTVQAWQTTRM